MAKKPIVTEYPKKNKPLEFFDDELNSAFKKLLSNPIMPDSKPQLEAAPKASEAFNRLTKGAGSQPADTNPPDPNRESDLKNKISELAKQSTLINEPELDQKLVPLVLPDQKSRTMPSQIYEALQLFSQFDNPIAQMQNVFKRAALDTLNADKPQPARDTENFLSIDAPTSDILQQALRNLREQKAGLKKEYDDTEAKGREQLKGIYEELKAPQTMQMPELFARIALALGPALLGQAMGQMSGIGSAGGAAGGQAGVAGLKELDTSIKDERSRQKEALLKYYGTLSDQEKEKLKQLTSQSDLLQKQIGELFMLQPKIELESQRDVARALAENAAKKFVEKGGMNKNQETMKMLNDFIKEAAAQGNERAKTLLGFLGPIIAKDLENKQKEKEIPRPFPLGYGIVPRPDVDAKDITTQMTGKAQEIAADYGSLKASVDRLGQLAKRGVIKGMIPLSQERDDVKSAVTDLFTKLKNNYVKAGAALSPGEEALVKQLGVDPSKDVAEMVRMATIPDNFLKLVQRTSNMIVNDASNKLYPYGYKMGQTKAEAPKPFITGKGKPEIPKDIQKDLNSPDMQTRINAKKRYLEMLQKK